MKSDTQFSMKGGKFQVRWDWAVRAVSLLLLLGANAQIWLTREFISREEFKQRENAIGSVQSTMTSMARTLADLEARLNAIEERLPDAKPQRKGNP